MLTNRSVPCSTVLPHIVYQDVAAAIAWLTRTFGFSEHYRYGDPADPSGAQMYFGDIYFMLRKARPGNGTPRQLGSDTQSLTIFFEDVDEHYRRARSSGAKILEEPHVTPYGEYQYAAEDLDGHHWLFSKHAKDVSPEDWGALIKHA